eukprot:gene5175-10349_t
MLIKQGKSLWSIFFIISLSAVSKHSVNSLLSRNAIHSRRVLHRQPIRSMAMADVRVTTYNVLSSHLGGPDYYTKCKPEALAAEKRLELIKQKLDIEINSKSIICLQEVSTVWAGFLHAYFSQKGYHFVTGLYGSKFNGYMGVGVAVPNSEYDILNVDITRIADTKRTIRRPKPSFIAKLFLDFKHNFQKFLRSLNLLKRAPQDPWKEALNRMNQMISLKLRSKQTQKSFHIGTYHLPCMFFLPQVMMIHSALSAQHIQKLAKNDPYIFVGDFNIKPDSSMYKLLTQGEVESNNPELPVMDPEDNWSPKVTPLRSAYKEFNSKEPDFTNYAQVKEEPAFIDTLDYIFLSKQWKVNEVLFTPHRDSIDGPLPNEKEPSDHIIIGANISC